MPHECNSRCHPRTTGFTHWVDCDNKRRLCAIKGAEFSTACPTHFTAQKQMLKSVDVNFHDARSNAQSNFRFTSRHPSSCRSHQSAQKQEVRKLQINVFFRCFCRQEQEALNSRKKDSLKKEPAQLARRECSVGLKLAKRHQGTQNLGRSNRESGAPFVCIAYPCGNSYADTQRGHRTPITSD